MEASATPKNRIGLLPKRKRRRTDIREKVMAKSSSGMTSRKSSSVHFG